jgi:hypothetical protein
MREPCIRGPKTHEERSLKAYGFPGMLIRKGVISARNISTNHRRCGAIQRYQKGKHVMAEPGFLDLRSDLRFNAGKREEVLENWQSDFMRLAVNIRFNSAVAKISGKSGDFAVETSRVEVFRTEAVVLAIGVEGNPGKIDGVNLWFTEQLENAERYLTLLQSPLFTPSGLIPEIAFYDCYACHHSKDKMRWSQARAGAGVKPGTLRLQKHSLVMLQAVVESLGTPDALAQLNQGTDALVRAGESDAASVRTAAQKLLDQLHALEPWARRAYMPAEVAKVRKTLLRYAAEDKASDFGVAEQVVLGVESLSYSLGDHDRRKAPLDALFGAVKSGSDFNATQFADVAKRAQGQF